MKKIKISLKNNDGFALIIALLALVILTAIGLSALYLSNTEISITGNERSANRLLFLAEGGIDKANNIVWRDSGFGSATTVSFTPLDNYINGLGALPALLVNVDTGAKNRYKVAVTGYGPDPATGDKVVTYISTGWYDNNNNQSVDPDEPQRAVEAKVRFSYTSFEFPYGVLTQNTECLLCHAQINGDVVSLESVTIRKENEAYSIINGKIYTAGITNLDAPFKDSNGVYQTADGTAVDSGGHPDKDGDGKFYSKVVSAYSDGNGDYSTVEGNNEQPIDITTGYSDPRFPLDANGNPSWPKIEDLSIYKTQAAAYKDGAGSSITGGTIKGVSTGSTYSGGAGATTIATVSQTYAGNLILDGTASCIVIDGPIVVDGDIVIKGCVKGAGNIYTGGNIYLAGAVTYSDASTDKLALAAGGNVVMGDYRPKATASTGGGDFIDKQAKEFNSKTESSGIPSGDRRYYKCSDGTICKNGGTITPAGGDEVVAYTPETYTSNKWITTNEYAGSFLDLTTGISQIDTLIYTSNAIFGINKVGQKKTTVNGALVSADIGILIPGPDGHAVNYDPAKIGLTLNYDDRMRNFMFIARNPKKEVVSWREVAPQ
ncbi:MAG: hypothetical protein HZA13_06965 [Nitrospirae bacterium]|nr:hypothetical protein [Nitrospirota bacterium]